MKATIDQMGTQPLRRQGFKVSLSREFLTVVVFDGRAHCPVPFVRAFEHRLRHPCGKSALRRHPGHRRPRPDAGRPAGRFDLSVAGGVSLAVVISTHIPAGDGAKAACGAFRGLLRDCRRDRERRDGRPPAPERDRRHDRHERLALRGRFRRLRRHSTNDELPCLAGSPAATPGRWEFRVLCCRDPGDRVVVLKKRSLDGGSRPSAQSSGGPGRRPSRANRNRIVQNPERTDDFRARV